MLANNRWGYFSLASILNWSLQKSPGAVCLQAAVSWTSCQLALDLGLREDVTRKQVSAHTV